MGTVLIDMFFFEAYTVILDVKKNSVHLPDITMQFPDTTMHWLWFQRLEPKSASTNGIFDATPAFGRKNALLVSAGQGSLWPRERQ